MKIENINNIGLIGAGTMGAGIAQCFAQSGFSVLIVDQNQAVLDKCLARVNESLALFAEFGLLLEKPPEIIARIRASSEPNITEIFKLYDFVIECIPEILGLKRELFSRLDSLNPDIILSSNTSTFTISSITAGMRTATRVVGTHFFFPPQILPLVEIHRGQTTTDDVVEITRQLMVRAGKKPILLRKEVQGFVVNRIQAAIGREANYLIEQGIVSPEDFDLAARASYGFRLANVGPLAQADLNGLDTKMRSDELNYKEICSSTELSQTFVEKVKRGEIGLKSGKGYYDYTGKSQTQILNQVERNLLKQLVLFKQREG